MPSIPPPSAPPSQNPSQGTPVPASHEPASRRLDEPPWPAWTAPAAVAAGFGLGIFVSIFVGIAAQASGSSLTNPTPAVALIGDFLFDLSFVAAAVYFALRSGAHLGDFGLRRLRPAMAVGGVLSAGIAYYVLTSIYASL